MRAGRMKRICRRDACRHSKNASPERLIFTKIKSPASLDRLAKSLRPPAVEFAPCEPLSQGAVDGGDQFFPALAFVIGKVARLLVAGPMNTGFCQPIFGA